MNINKLLHGPNVAGQSLVDRVMAAKHSLTGEGLAKSVCKATTEEQMPPKKKHIDYLLQCTHEPNVSVPQLAGLLVERAQNEIWIVVFKSLISTHTLMNYGNERFMQYLASNNCSFNCDGFIDKTSPQGYDMSPFVRRYAKYLNAKAFSYRQMAYDFCKIKKGKDDGVLRIMEIDKLLKVLPILQTQVDTLLEFDVTRAELNNSVINASFMMLFKDLIRLLACYNDGIINLLAKYFEMTRKQCKEALDIYKKFVSSMENVAKFLAVAESVGIDKGDIPDLAKAPSSLLEALEAHMKSLEGTKKGTKSDASVTNAIQALTATTAHNGTGDDQSSFFDESSAVVVSSNNPFADVLQPSDLDDNSAAVDAFDLFDPAAAAGSQAVDDFNDGFSGKSAEGAAGGLNPFFVSVAGNEVESNGEGAAFVITQDDPWSCQASQGGNPSGFATDDAFAAAFGQEAATTDHVTSDLATRAGSLNITSSQHNQASSEHTNHSEWNASSVSVPAGASSTGEESNTIHVTSNSDDSSHQQEDNDADLFADLR